jgi:hypothetical protein
MSKPKAYWRIEIIKHSSTTFRRTLPGNLSSDEIAIILQRLACRNLTPREIVSASIRKPRRTSLLEYRVDGRPHALRTTVWIQSMPEHVASYWRAEDLPEKPDIDTDD